MDKKPVQARGHCNSCRLECKYRDWRQEHPEFEKDRIATAEFLRARVSRNPKCPAEDEKYIELMNKCENRESYDASSDTCVNCKDRLKIITHGDMKKAPISCPIRDPMKNIGIKLEESIRSIGQIMNSINIPNITLPNFPRFSIPPILETYELEPSVSREIEINEINTQLRIRIKELGNQLEIALKEIDRLRKRIKEFEEKSDDEPYYIR